MKILLVLPAAERYRVTRDRPGVPQRAMLRFSVLPLTTVAALAPPGHDEVRRAPRDFIFIDDNLIADPAYARLLFHAMAPLRKRWVAQASVLIADDAELLRLARDAGCRGLFVGIESTDEAGLRSLDKGFNDARRLAARIEAIRRAGIGIVAGMIVGTDADDAGCFRRTLAFLRDAGADALQLNILTPLPGTPLFGNFERAGRIADRDWGHYDFRHVVFRPAQMSPETLQAGADWVYAQFYRLDRILWRFAKGLVTVGCEAAWLGLRLGMTYRYDNRREGIVGRDPARRPETAAPSPALTGRNKVGETVTA
jgi:radical SAM superfamily enzyme YgiQ (UPF0313 family)